MSVIAAKEINTLPLTLQQCLEALDLKKAEDIRVLYVGEISSITDYFLIATGTSNPHLKALGEAVMDVLRKNRESAAVSGIGDRSGWVVVDAFDFMVHIFSEEMRQYYNLEGLWKDAHLVAY